MRSGLILVLISLPFVLADDENAIVRCFQPGECTSSTQVDLTLEEDVDSCANACQDNDRCNFFSFNQQTNSCALLENCKKVSTELEVFLSGPKNCSLSASKCYAKVSCSSSSVFNVTGLSDINQCWSHCHTEEQCSYYEFNESTKICLGLATCPSYEESNEKITTSVYGCVERFNCFKNFRCIGNLIENLVSPSVELCYHYCKSNAECEWFVQDDDIEHCSLFSTCEERVDCSSCVSGKFDCSHGNLPNVFLQKFGGRDVKTRLTLSFISDLSPLAKQPDMTLYPKKFSLAASDVNCWSSHHQIAVICSNGQCFHYKPSEDKWAYNATQLLSSPAKLFHSYCTELPDGDLLITGVPEAQKIQPSITAPPPASEPVPSTMDYVRTHCAPMINNTHIFMGFGFQSSGAFLLDVNTWETTEILANEISVFSQGCALVTHPESGKKSILIVGGKWSNGPVPDLTGVLFIDTDDWSWSEGMMLPYASYGPEKFKGTDLPLFIAYSKNGEIRKSSFLLWDFQEGWITKESPSSVIQNSSLFGIALSME